MTRIDQILASALAAAVIILPFGAAVGLGHGSASAEPPNTHSAPRVCFDRERWGPVAPAHRPCLRIVRLFEDGSALLQGSDADGSHRYTVPVGTPVR
jgi:hypothetical protein